MPFSYQIIPEQNLVINTIQGQFDFSDYLVLMESILNDPLFVPAMNMFWDWTASTLIDLSKEDFQKIKDCIQTNVARRGIDYRAVFLVRQDVDFGLSRMYQLLSEDLPVQLEIFRDREQALNWIRALEGK